VAFLQEDAGVPHVSFLANRYLLVVLARFFALYWDVDVRNRKLLRRWFWRAAVVGPGHFKGDTTGAIRKLCKLIRPDDLSGSVQALLDAVSDVDPPTLPDLRRFSAREATTKIVLCSWWAAEPRSPVTEQRYDKGQLSRCLDERQTASEAVVSLETSSALPKHFRTHAANRVLLPAEDGEDAERLVSGGVHAERREWSDVLASHALSPRLVSLLAEGEVDEFVVEREEILRKRLDDFLGNMCEWGFENTPPLADLVGDVEGEFLDEGPTSGTVLGA
jgi:hypothetical protein